MSDEEFQSSVEAIEEGKLNFSEDEQNIISAWIAKLSEFKETEEENAVRNEYARALAKLTTQEKRLLPPFTELPEDGDLPPLPSYSSHKSTSYPTWKMPCSNPNAVKTRRQSSLSPRPKRRERSVPLVTSDDNEFEDAEEMARIIAQSKGQTFPEFVMAISRHTADSGQILRIAMKTETTNFKEYVDRVLTQRLKDLTQALDEEHNTQLQKIRKDIDKWELELTHCKKRIKEMIPDFDLEMYKKDKKYLKKIFVVETPGSAKIDALQAFVEDASLEIDYYMQKAMKTARCNEVLAKNTEAYRAKIMDMEAAESMRQQVHLQEMNCEIAEYQKLKEERDQIHKEIVDLLEELQQRGS